MIPRVRNGLLAAVTIALLLGVAPSASAVSFGVPLGYDLRAEAGHAAVEIAELGGSPGKEVIQVGHGGVSVFPYSGDGALGVPAEVPLPGLGRDLSTTDLDLDGDTDVVAGTDMGVVALRNDGT